MSELMICPESSQTGYASPQAETKSSQIRRIFSPRWESILAGLRTHPYAGQRKT